MFCPWCTGENSDKNILAFDKKNVDEHLIIVRDKNAHTHVHGPFENAVVMKDIILLIARECKKHGLDLFVSEKGKKENQKPIVKEIKYSKS